jgi:hypothetical protein
MDEIEPSVGIASMPTFEEAAPAPAAPAIPEAPEQPAVEVTPAPEVVAQPEQPAYVVPGLAEPAAVSEEESTEDKQELPVFDTDLIGKEQATEEAQPVEDKISQPETEAAGPAQPPVSEPEASEEQEVPGWDMYLPEPEEEESAPEPPIQEAELPAAEPPTPEPEPAPMPEIEPIGKVFNLDSPGAGTKQEAPAEAAADEPESEDLSIEELRKLAGFDLGGFDDRPPIDLGDQEPKQSEEDKPSPP